jgi:hypothetical protein
MKQRVLCYITRERKDILVFEGTEDYPNAGIQVPGGGIKRSIYEFKRPQLTRAVARG